MREKKNEQSPADSGLSENNYPALCYHDGKGIIFGAPRSGSIYLKKEVNFKAGSLACTMRSGSSAGIEIERGWMRRTVTLVVTLALAFGTGGERNGLASAREGIVKNV